MRSPGAVPGIRTRWWVLGVGVFAQMAVAIAFIPGLSAVAPAVAADYRLDLVQIGLLFTAVQIGFLLTTAVWGVVADRWGDRLALSSGLAGAAVALAGATLVAGYVPLVLAMIAASMLASSTNVASARVAVAWFSARERGLALGIRQMSLPLGGAVGALLLPGLTTHGGTRAALAFVAGLCAVAAVVAALGLRRAPAVGRTAGAVARPPGRAASVVRDPNLLRLGFGVGLLVFGQNSLLTYFVLFLTVYRHLSLQSAALAFLVVQLGAVVIRIGGGRLSDQIGSRIRPIRWAAAGVVVLVGVLVATLDVPLPALLPLLVAATIVSMSVTGLSYTAAAEIAGVERAGVAVGVQVTILSLAGSAGPAVFGQLVTTAGWRAGLVLVAVLAGAASLVLRPLLVRERRELAGPAATCAEPT